MNNVNVLFFPTRYFPSISGAEFYFQRIAEILNSRDSYSSELITSNAVDFRALRDINGKTIEEDEKYFSKVNNIKVKRYPVTYNFPLEERVRKIKSFSEYTQLNISDEALIEFIQNGPYMNNLIGELYDKNSFDYDLIHTTFYPYLNLLISLILGLRHDVPVVCTPFFHYENPRYDKGSCLKILHNFNLIIACTELEKQALIRQANIEKESIKVIPMGVDFEIFKNFKPNPPSFPGFKKKFLPSSSQDYKMVLFCGYKNYEKGAITILRSIPRIIQSIKPVCFVFIGPSTQAYNRELSKIPKIEGLKILNFTPDNLKGYFDKIKLSAFKETDLYVMPSRSDAYGIAFLEAWASGKAVIGAKCGATKQVIRDGFDGYLVDFDDPKDLSKKIIALLKNEGLRRLFGCNGQKKVFEHNSWERIAYLTSVEYQKLLTKGKS